MLRASVLIGFRVLSETLIVTRTRWGQRPRGEPQGHLNLLELDVSKQRLDSTHIESNMAKFGRMKLMATTIRRFLVKVKRHDEGSYNGLKKQVQLSET